MKVKLMKELDGHAVGEVVDAQNWKELVELGYAAPILGQDGDADAPDDERRKAELDELVKSIIAEELEAEKKKRPKDILTLEDVRDHRYQGIFSTRNEASLFGHLVLGVALGVEKSLQRVRDAGWPIVRAMSEGDNLAGGVFVPEGPLQAIIELMETYGTFRANAQVVPMSRDTQPWPILSDDGSGAWLSEGGTFTPNDPTTGRASLVAKKLGALRKLSTELGEDSALPIAELLARGIARIMSKMEDQAGFIGDGTSTYGGHRGVTTRLKELSGTIANIAGLIVGAGNAYSELTLANFESIAGLLPSFADASPQWFVHKYFYFTVMYRLALAAGGANATEIITGVISRSPTYLGSPVVFVPVMPKAEANSQVCCLFGDLRQAALLGDRRQLTIETSREAYFTTDEIGVRGTERVGINVHSVGNASATASERQAGPIVGLITAAA